MDGFVFLQVKQPCRETFLMSEFVPVIHGMVFETQTPIKETISSLLT